MPGKPLGQYLLQNYGINKFKHINQIMFFIKLNNAFSIITKYRPTGKSYN